MKKYMGGVLVVLAILVITFLLGVVLGACASTRRVPLYDGDDVTNLVTDAPSGTVLVLVPVTIHNDRSRDLIDPFFYLIGNGRHPLGRVESLSTRRVFVDSKWLVAADGCFRIVAHYVGQGDLTYDKVCWRSGEVVDVTLSTLFNSGAAWSHR